ncbi:Zn-finger in ubiquitin-hydrolase and other protein [Dictyocaulus viviparus]|uniref:Zn-finger in ubiquitin-hydrolase and other protein n=1 Tax=Dictyocaulus viviparus TaxID=29172 RepID=A0A0D8XAQ5_DICVI|nr:Zn-finger in ubiquitin-hydrolase and other protein [Dictyocaulus viviparus]
MEGVLKRTMIIKIWLTFVTSRFVFYKHMFWELYHYVEQVHCGRYVHGHALMHHMTEPSHAMSLSLADLSVWCYACEAYVHNERLVPAKSAAHLSKFGEATSQ